MPSRSVSCFGIICRTGTGLKTMSPICTPNRGVPHWDVCIFFKMKCTRLNERLSVKTAQIISLGVSASIKISQCADGGRHGLRINITKRIPSVLVYIDSAYRSLQNFCININLVGAIRPRFFRPRPPPYALHRITIQFHPFRQRPHRQQIDEHQRRHQNGYKAFYFIPHCLILLFHLEAALPLLPERSKRICGQTVRRLKKKISEKRARHSCAACSVGSVFQPKISALTRQ